MLNEVFGQSYAYGRMTTIVTVLADDVEFFPSATLHLRMTRAWLRFHFRTTRRIIYEIYGSVNL